VCSKKYQLKRQILPTTFSFANSSLILSYVSFSLSPIKQNFLFLLTASLSCSLETPHASLPSVKTAHRSMSFDFIIQVFPFQHPSQHHLMPSRSSQITNINPSFAIDDTRLRLHKSVHISPKTNSSTPVAFVTCSKPSSLPFLLTSACSDQFPLGKFPNLLLI